MKNQQRLTLPFLACLLLAVSIFTTSCAALLGEFGNQGGNPPMPVDPGIGNGMPVSFTILQLNDVYEIAPLEKGKVGGLARVATLRNQLHTETYNVLTVMAGDFVSPSLIGTLKYEDKRIRGRQMVETMNALGVGLVTFGNHEFDIKESELQERMNESYFDWLGTNVLHQAGGKVEPFHKLSYDYKYFAPETYIWEVYDELGGSVKVGFYSATI
ncbi:MAG: metallophosphoesterase, partial [Bacteroidota bacterium]